MAKSNFKSAKEQSTKSASKATIEGTLKSKLANGDFKVVNGIFEGKAEGLGAKVAAKGISAGKKIGSQKIGGWDIFWICVALLGLGAWVGVLIYQAVQARSKRQEEEARAEAEKVAAQVKKEDDQKKAEQRLESKVEELAKKVAAQRPV